MCSRPSKNLQLPLELRPSDHGLNFALMAPHYGWHFVQVAPHYGWHFVQVAPHYGWHFVQVVLSAPSELAVRVQDASVRVLVVRAHYAFGLWHSNLQRKFEFQQLGHLLAQWRPSHLRAACWTSALPFGQ